MTYNRCYFAAAAMIVLFTAVMGGFRHVLAAAIVGALIGAASLLFAKPKDHAEP